IAVGSSCPATFRRTGPLCLFLPLGCSQLHAVLGGLLIRRPHTPLKFTSDHTGLYLLTRQCLQSSDIFLRPGTQFRSLRHLSSLSTDHRSLSQNKQSPESVALPLRCTLSRAIRVSRGDVDNRGSHSPICSALCRASRPRISNSPSGQRPNPRLRPKLHSMPLAGIMTPETCRPRCCSRAGRHGTSWNPSPSSIMANRPDASATR